MRPPICSILSRRLLAGGLAAAGLAASAAQAQAPAPAPAETAPPAAARSELAPVTVSGSRASTATKTDTPLTETPQAISVIDAEQIRERGAIGLQEALRYSAGLRTEPNGADFRFDYVTSRGGFEAAQYLDGLRRAEGYYAGRIEPYTLERLEVLRGPSSVLYGQGSAGGIVNAMSKRPREVAAGEVGLQLGSYRRRQFQLDLTGPLDEDRGLSGRIVALVRDARTQTDFSRDDRVVLMPSLRWQPSADTDLVATLLYQRDRAASTASFLPVGATLQAAPGRELRWGAYLGEPSHNYDDTNQTSATAQLTHRFSEALSLTSALRLTRAKTWKGDIEADIWNGLENPFLDADRRVLPRYRYDFNSRVAALSTDHSLRWNFETGPLRHEALAGLDYSRVRLLSETAYGTADPIDIYAPVYGNVAAAELAADPRLVDAQLGLYLQDQIRIRDALTVVAGVRRDRARTSAEGDPGQVDYATSWRFGAIGEVLAGLSPYVNYAESFQPTVGLDFYGNAYVPQRGRQIEAGLKWAATPRTLVTLAAYRIKGTNRLTNDPTNGENMIQQGEVKSRGIELEAQHRSRGGFEVSASWSRVDAKISRSNEPLEIGLPIAAVPRHEGTLWAQQRVALDHGIGLTAGLGARYVGRSREASVVDGAVISLDTPSFTLFDAVIALERGPWSFALNGTNLADRKYYGSCSPNTACGQGYRRNVVGTLSYRY